VWTHVPPDLFCIINTVQLDEQLDVVLVLAPRTEVIRYAGAREAAKNGRAIRLQAGIPSHPERRAGGKRQEVRQEITGRVHDIDCRLIVGDGDVHVQPEDQKRTRQLLQLLDDTVVANAGRENLILPMREGVGTGCGNGETDAFGAAREFASSAEDFGAKLGNVSANACPDFHDRLMQLGFDLLTERGRT
jgi:hypothetical protein